VPHAGSIVRQADVHIAVAMAYYDMGEYEKGLEHARIGGERALSVNGLECACAGFYNVGRGHLSRNELDKALQELKKSLSIAERATTTSVSGLSTAVRGTLALAEFEQGSEAAIERLRASVNEARGNNDTYGASTLSLDLVAALLKLGRHQEAAGPLELALEYFRQADMRPYIARALELAATMHEEAGRAEEAESARREAATMHVPVVAPQRPQPVAQG
jgi:tetratricopeptide (TPR) repeat protein